MSTEKARKEPYAAVPGGNLARAAVAEAVGTFILVFSGIAVVTAAALPLPIAGVPYNSLAVGLAFGLVLAGLVATLGHVSGAHFNPAVTLGLASTGKFPARAVAPYLVAQFVGAIAAGAADLLAFGEKARALVSLGATYPAPGVSDGTAFFVEFVITFILVFVIMGTATDQRATPSAAGVSIGFALGVAVLVGGPLTGGAVNPARALGPMIVAGKFTSAWVYLIAPTLGGIVAALFYDRVLARTSPPKG